MLRAKALAVLAVTACLAAAAPGYAQQDNAQGRVLFNDGVSLMNDGKYEAACAKLEASLKLLPGLGTRGKLAECYEKLGRLATAFTLYKELATLAKSAGDATREKVATDRARALEPKLSFVTIVIGPNDPNGLVVKRNGKDVDRSKYGAAEPVDAGQVAIEASAPGKKRFAQTVNVTTSQAMTVTLPALESLPAAAVVPPPPPPPQKDEPPLPAAAFPPAEVDSTPWQKPVGLVAAGLGVVALGVGGFFGFDAKSKYDAPFDDGRCDRATNQCDASGQGAIDDARSRATLSTVFVVTGGVLAVGGLVLYFTAPASHRPTTGMRVGPGGAGFAF